MFKVSFCPEGHDLPDSACPVEVFTSQTDVEAIQFALSLHQASNVPHSVVVYSPSGEDVCFLSKVEK